MRNHVLALFLVAACCALGGCSFVQLTDAGSGVAQASAADVANCREVGTISSNTKSRVVLERNSASVREELIVLARNQAAQLGANAIVPIGEPVDGTQSFRAYDCD
jgi:hypothetical protein